MSCLPPTSLRRQRVQPLHTRLALEDSGEATGLALLWLFRRFKKGRLTVI
jgi:hypothetical protein